MTKKTWVVVVETRHSRQVKADDGEKALKNVLRQTIGTRLRRSDITEVSVGWLDPMGISHLETCQGKHCGHYDCRDPNDDVPGFCSQCEL